MPTDFSVTQWGLIAFTAIGLFIFLGIVMYIDYLRERDGLRKKNQEYDPFVRAIIGSVFIMAIGFMAEAIGIFEQGSNKKYFAFYIAIFIGILMYYYMSAYLKKPYSLKKQHEIIISALKQFYHIEPYHGDGDIPPLMIYKVTEEKGGDIANFIVTYMLNGRTKTEFLVKMNIYPPGTSVHIQIRPHQAVIDNFIGRNVRVQSFENNMKRTLAEDDSTEN